MNLASKSVNPLYERYYWYCLAFLTIQQFIIL